MTTPTPTPSEPIAPNDLCPICHLLLFNPFRTHCNHLLCASCMSHWASASTTSSITPLPLGTSLSDLNRISNPAPDVELLKAKCPMCRTLTSGAVDKDLGRRLERLYPAIWEERRVEEEEEEERARVGVEGIDILIGNTHRVERGRGPGAREQANRHAWTFFVRCSRPDIVREVKVGLHPTFRPPQTTLRNPPFEISRLGWGTFSIEAEIVLMEPWRWVAGGSDALSSSLKLEWMLSFDGRGKQGRVRARVKKVEGQGIGAMDLDEDDEEVGDYEDDGGEENSQEEEENGANDDNNDGDYQDEASSGRVSPVRWPHMERGDA